MSVEYTSGAKRSDRYGRYRDIPVSLLTRIAEAFRIGTKYERPEDGWRPYEKNWKRGDLEFALDCLDHFLRHAHLYSDTIIARLNGVEHLLDPKIYDTQDDHLANAGANLAMLAWFEEQGMFKVPAEVEKRQEELAEELIQEHINPSSSISSESYEVSKELETNTAPGPSLKERIRNVFVPR